MFRGLPDDGVRALSLRYARWCRDLALVFERHGVARSREVIQQAGEDMCSGEYWNEGALLTAWVEARMAAPNERPLLAGWVTQTWQHAENTRESRTTRLALDGRTDPLLEPTNFDADFAHLYGPQLGPTPPATAVTEPGPSSAPDQEDSDRRQRTEGRTGDTDKDPPGESDATTGGQLANNSTSGDDHQRPIAVADALPPLMRNLVVSAGHPGDVGGNPMVS
jgi:hypothetical protein